MILWARGLLAGLAGAVAWMAGIFVIFGPAQVLLADPDHQSAKLLAAFSGGPPPRMGAAPWVLPVGLLCIGALWGWLYAGLTASWTGPWWMRGLRFSGVAWVLMVPWFEFYLPWNVLWEPAPLVALEMVCWAGVLLCVGLSIAAVEAALRPRAGTVATPS